MSEQSFESALAECLAAIDVGTPVEDVLARFPAHTEALRPALGLRAALGGRVAPLPPTMRARGEQRLQAALASPAPAGGIPVLSSLFGLLPKAATQALIALLVTGGAMGASAAAGGPNIPAEVLHAVGLVNDNANEHADAKGNAKGQAAKGTATAAAGLGPLGEPGDRGLLGLCNAYLKGGLGTKADENSNGKSNAAPASLARLQEAVGDLNDLKSVEDCTARFGGQGEEAPTAATAESGNQGRGKGLEKSGNAESTATSGQGKAPTSPPGKGR